MPNSLFALRWTVTAASVVLVAASGLAQQPPATQKPQPPQTQPGGGRQNDPGSFQRPAPLPFPQAPQDVEIIGGKLRAVPAVTNLANPWSLAFLPNGDMLVTERPGRLRIVRGGKLDPQPIAGTPQVYAQQQGGLLEVAVHPRFAENQFLYFTYSKPGTEPNTATTALARAKFDGKALSEMKDIFVADNMNKAGIHFGSKLAFGRDGLLYMSLGERNDRNRAQSLASHGGKVVRLRDDGSPAPGNPFEGKPGAKPEIYSYGHRNIQGLAFHPDTGALWVNEHGPQGGDELNLVSPGKNYGWPVATYGREYPQGGGTVISAPSKEGIEEPVLVWSPSIGVSGLMIYSGDKFPYWKGQFFSGGLSGAALHRVGLGENQTLQGRDAMLSPLRLRVRDVRQGPDGYIYLAIDGNPGGILRLEPLPTSSSTAGGE